MSEYGWFDEKAKSRYADNDSDLVAKSVDEEVPWTLGGR